MDANASSTRALRALADGHHGDDRADADDDARASVRNERSLVAQERAQRDAEASDSVFMPRPPRRRGPPRAAALARVLDDRGRPSRTITREA